MKVKELIEKLQDLNKEFGDELFLDNFGYLNDKDSMVRLKIIGELQWYKITFENTNEIKEMVTIND